MRHFQWVWQLDDKSVLNSTGSKETLLGLIFRYPPRGFPTGEFQFSFFLFFFFLNFKLIFPTGRLLHLHSPYLPPLLHLLLHRSKYLCPCVWVKETQAVLPTSPGGSSPQQPPVHIQIYSPLQFHVELCSRLQFLQATITPHCPSHSNWTGEGAHLHFPTTEQPQSQDTIPWVHSIAPRIAQFISASLSVFPF